MKKYKLLLNNKISLFNALYKFNFIYYDFFSSFFLIIYPFEEIIFIFLYNLNSEHKDLWVGLILIIILFTLTLDKIHLNSQKEKAVKKFKFLNAKIMNMQQKKIEKLQINLKKREQEKIKLLEYIQKSK